MSLTEPFNFSLLQTGNPAHGQMEISVSDCGRHRLEVVLCCPTPNNHKSNGQAICMPLFSQIGFLFVHRDDGILFHFCLSIVEPLVGEHSCLSWRGSRRVLLCILHARYSHRMSISGWPVLFPCSTYTPARLRDLPQHILRMNTSKMK